MRSAKKLITGLCLVSLFVGLLNADDNTGAWEPLAVTVQPERSRSEVPIIRAFVNARSDKFTFLIPEDFRLGGDPAHGRLRVENQNANVSITFTILLGPAPIDSATLDAGAYREMVCAKYPGGKILAEFQGHAAGGQGGPGFDLERIGQGGLMQKIRAVYLATPAGVLELTVTSGVKNFSAAQSSLAAILGTLNCGQNGKLTIHHLADTN